MSHNKRISFYQQYDSILLHYHPPKEDTMTIECSPEQSVSKVISLGRDSPS
jgi:hypothetical protein